MRQPVIVFVVERGVDFKSMPGKSGPRHNSPSTIEDGLDNSCATGLVDGSAVRAKQGASGDNQTVRDAGALGAEANDDETAADSGRDPSANNNDADPDGTSGYGETLRPDEGA